MKITENFSLYELCKSDTASIKGIKNEPSEKEKANLIKLCKDILQPIRDKYGKPITITSGFRCIALNRAVGGSPTSQHVEGQAADIICENNKELFELIVKMIKNGEIKVGQLINEKNYSWIHISLPYKKINEILNL